MILMRAVKATAVAGAMVGTTLVAMPRASADDLPAALEVAPNAVVYQNASGVLMGLESDYGALNVNAAMAPGTSPSAAPIPGNYMFVWQGANHDLWTTSPTGPVDTGVAMAPGTSPSLAVMQDGSWTAAVHGADGYMHTAWSGSTSVWSGGTGIDTTAVRAPGPSPRAAAITLRDARTSHLVTGIEIAYQGTNNHLWLSARYDQDTGGVMAPGTSPSLAAEEGGPTIHGYYVAFQGGNGDLWSYDELPEVFTVPRLFDFLAPMAPGTSPSARDNHGATTVAFQGSNGHLWTQGNEVRYPYTNRYADADDTGLPMLAGSNPSLMVTPVDLPGKPLGGSTYCVGYVNGAGTVSIFASNPSSATDTNWDSGLAAAPGSSPAVVSALNWIYGGWVTGSDIHSDTTTPAGTTAAAPLPPSKPTIEPDTAPVVGSDTCVATHPNLEPSAAGGSKTVHCATATSGPPPATAQAATPAVTPNAAVPALCGNYTNVWEIDRTDECIQTKTINYSTRDSNGGLLGTSLFLVSQDIILSTSSDLFTENDTIYFVTATGVDLALPHTTTFAVTCASPCAVLSGGTTTFASFRQGQSGTISTTYEDAGPKAPDTFGISYTLPDFIPGSLPGTFDQWSLPAPIRCDNNTPNYTKPGCVVSSFTPTLELPLSVYGAAAYNVKVGSEYLPGTPGLTTSTPLTRGDPTFTNANRAITCSGFKPLPPGNPHRVVDDSCDEYPFAASQQSGGALKVAGSNCLEIAPIQDSVFADTWFFVSFNKYTNVYPQVCLRGHVNSAQNSAVGTALGAFYTNNRMMVGDPYTVHVTD
jgi:hypothetical protein